MADYTVDDLQMVTFPVHADADAALAVFQGGGDVPFDIRRVFTVAAEVPVQRGHHAHRQCKQLLVAIRGRIDVTCDDGAGKKTITLDSPKQGLLIPETIWAEQNYTTPGGVLVVLCSHEYDPDDYIRDYDNFLAYKGSVA